MSQKYIIEEVIDIETGEKKFKDQYHGVFEALYDIEEGFTMMLLDMVTLKSIQTTPIKSITKYEDKDKKWLVIVTKNSTYCLQEV